jgi:FHS family L-fucose permease-like MFS transporter
MPRNKFLIPFILVTSLFFLWGFAHSILDVLNKHFQEVLVISKARSAMVQMVVYGGYFLAALPAGFFIRRFGYRKGVVFGLLLYGLGALLFIPAENIMSFNYFLFSLFVIGCGLTFLETAANPYITELGDREGAARRLNLAQSFNGLGWIVGPLVGGMLIFQADGSHGSAALPYTLIGIIVLLVAAVFTRVKLPEIRNNASLESTAQTRRLWLNRLFVFGVIAQFFYVGAQTGINSFFINYVTEVNPAITPRTAALILSFGGMGLFMTGRFLGSWLMRFIEPSRLLGIAAIGATLCMAVVVAAIPTVSMIALFVTYLFESIMFPTIFALSVSGLGEQQKKQGSSFLIMAIVGGAIAPVFMGMLGEQQMAIGFIIPLCCFIVVYAFSRAYGKSLMPLKNNA